MLGLNSGGLKNLALQTPQSYGYSKDDFLSMKAQLYLPAKKRFEDVVLLCVESKLIFLNLKTNQPALKSVKTQGVEAVSLSENNASLASLQLNSESEALVGQSHITFQAGQIGIFIKFISLRNSNVRLSFTNQLQDYRAAGQTQQPLRLSELVASSPDVYLMHGELQMLMGTNWFVWDSREEWAKVDCYLLE